jgi:hypothetical protein
MTTACLFAASGNRFLNKALSPSGQKWLAPFLLALVFTVLPNPYARAQPAHSQARSPIKRESLQIICANPAEHIP